jgi:hypothetical protein
VITGVHPPRSIEGLFQKARENARQPIEFKRLCHLLRDEPKKTQKDKAYVVCVRLTHALRNGFLDFYSDGHVSPKLAALTAEVEQAAYSEGAFSTLDTFHDDRRRELGLIVRRRGQPEFRQKLINAYQGRCALTGCDVVETLEAAHILPYRGAHTNHVQNGLLLRADIHTLFDLNLMTIDPETFVVVLVPMLKGTTYGKMDGKLITLPARKECWPSRDALRERNKQFVRDF